MFGLGPATRIYLAAGATDMRCGFVHRPADLLRLDWDRLQCKQYQQAFESRPDKEERKAEPK